MISHHGTAPSGRRFAKAIDETVGMVADGVVEYAQRVIVGRVAQQVGLGIFGYNAQTGEYTDMIKAGILDPTKVVRTAAQAQSIEAAERTARVLAIYHGVRLDPL